MLTLTIFFSVVCVFAFLLITLSDGEAASLSGRIKISRFLNHFLRKKKIFFSPVTSISLQKERGVGGGAYAIGKEKHMCIHFII